MTILEDTRQKTGKHNLKHEWFTEHGITLYRSKLPFGDYAPPPPVAIDTKENMEEIAGNICGREHSRFINECKAARDVGCQLIILVENTDDITSVYDVHLWENPRMVYSPKCVQGPQLEKAMLTIHERYGVQFLFCTPDKSAETIDRIIREYGK